jgi:hypothetical protein
VFHIEQFGFGTVRSLQDGWEKKTRSLSLGVLEEWQAEWRESALSCLKQLERRKAFFHAAYIRRWIDEDPARSDAGSQVPAATDSPLWHCLALQRKIDIGFPWTAEDNVQGTVAPRQDETEANSAAVAMI